ncbi:MAG TPA: PKD domain-containing protein [Nakamurella sp.]
MSKFGLIRSRMTSLVAVTALIATGLTVATVAAPIAAADPGPIQSSTVTADALPTAQIDGVAWVQRVVGNTVFVGGQFSNARPAGAAVGTQQVARNNLMSYDITTGVMTSWAPNLNGQVKAMAVSPDGTRLYVGGSFTSVNGITRSRLAAFDTATGALLTSFATPSINSTVNSIVATTTAVYIGGVFGVAGGQTRNRLAAFSPTNGAVLGWAPSADATVNALALTGDGGIVVGGAFQTINGASSYGLGKVSQANGTKMPWNPSAAGHTVANAGSNSAILSLSTDGTAVYGTGYHFGSGGNLEGAFSADPVTGALNWVTNCHGDTYDAAPVAGAVFTVSHAHYCTPVGGFPQSDPWSTNMRRALAFTTNATGTNSHDEWGYYDWYNAPSPSMINWFPMVDSGTFTGKTQGAWSVSGNSNYVVLGGEFPKVNNTAQQGLVRFAVRSIAPNAQGPEYQGSKFMPTITALPTGARVSWQANSDKDDNTLNYRVTRDGAVVYEGQGNSTFWNRPTVGFVDRNLTAGTTYRYRLSATDSTGNTVQSEFVNYTAAAANGSTAHADRVIADGASSYWPLNETSGSAVYDNAGYDDATTGAGVSRNQTGAITGDAATTFNGSTTASAGTSTKQAGSTTFTAQAWIKTTTTSGGKILGFGSSSTGNSANYDRHIYMDNAGRLFFGVYPGGVRTVNSDPGFNDGKWHQITATLGPDGMKLYVDAKLVAQRADTTSAQSYQGYWRIGGDNLNGWTNQPTSNYFNGAVDEVAIYPTVLPLDTIANQFALGGTAAPSNQAPTASFTANTSALTVNVDGSGSSDPDGSVASYAWNWGDGTPAGAGASANHAYTAAGTYTVTLTVTDNAGAQTSVSQPVQVTAPAPNEAPTAAFTQTADGLTANLTSTSTDTDGEIVSYEWTFGDGSTGDTSSAVHTYPSGGTYTVTLKVTDDDGATGTVTHPVTVTAPPAQNQPPVAAFTTTSNGPEVTFDGNGSADSDGTIRAYSWTFGDGTTDPVTTAVATHTFATAGTYTVELTVTDDDGATNKVGKAVTVSAPAPNALVSDTFARTVAGGLGTADTGGAWTTTSAASNFSVGGGTGKIKMAAAGSGPTATLPAVAVADVDLTVDVALDKAGSGGGTFVSTALRRVGNSEYRTTTKFLAGGAVQLQLVKIVGGVSTSLRTVNIPGLTYAANDVVTIRFQAVGDASVALNARVWKAGTTEPAAWQASAVDSSNTLSTTGGVAIYPYLSGTATLGAVTATLDNLKVVAVAP